MNISLTKELAEKGDKLIINLLNEKSLENDFVYKFIGDKDKATILCKYLENLGIINLIGATEGDDFLIITENTGLLTFLKNGGITKIYLDLNKKREKEDIEFEKSKIDLELSKKVLEEFPKTKWFARIGFLIGIILMLKELYILIWK